MAVVWYRMFHFLEYEGVHAPTVDESLALSSLDATVSEDDWRPIEVERYTRNHEGEPLLRADFPNSGVGSVLVLRDTAVAALSDVLRGNGKILPLKTNDDVPLFAFAPQAIAAMEEERSDIQRIPGTNVIMSIRRPALVASRLRGVDMFRLPGRVGPIWVSGGFVTRVEAAGLVGVEFVEVATTEE